MHQIWRYLKRRKAGKAPVGRNNAAGEREHSGFEGAQSRHGATCQADVDVPQHPPVQLHLL